MEKNAYQIATENEREAIKTMLRTRDKELARFVIDTVLEKLVEQGMLIETGVDEEMPDDIIEGICRAFWDQE